ncbi:MAG: DUF4252 domain-containing protein [Lewinellaceae bacterium]|jgi:hypothetical protein|nr:DUF4252 domain-containing protein [Lewinellaceae bacterium]
MKTCLLGLFLTCAIAAGAQDYGLYWKYKDYDGGIALTVPSLAIDMGSWFVDNKTDRVLLRKINKVRVMYFENGENPVTERDLRRFDRKAKRRHLEDLLFVREGKMRVRILGKERNNVIRKIVVLVSSPDEFALVSIKGKFRWDDISKVLDKYGKKSGKDGKSIVPPAVKVPVKRV